MAVDRYGNRKRMGQDMLDQIDAIVAVLLDILLATAILSLLG